MFMKLINFGWPDPDLQLGESRYQKVMIRDSNMYRDSFPQFSDNSKWSESYRQLRRDFSKEDTD